MADSPAAVNERGNLHALFDAFFQEQLKRNPTLATSPGFDKGELAGLKSQLSERSPAAIARNKEETARRLTHLRNIDRSALSGADLVNYDTLLFINEVREEGDRKFNYGAGGLGEPYILSQLSGAYHFVQDFLDTEHRINTAEDAEPILLASACRLALSQVHSELPGC